MINIWFKSNLIWILSALIFGFALLSNVYLTGHKWTFDAVSRVRARLDLSWFSRSGGTEIILESRLDLVLEFFFWIFRDFSRPRFFVIQSESRFGSQFWSFLVSRFANCRKRSFTF